MMRLTLRTLLAYLDDMLEPANTKVIGQKIQESPMAQLLVSRIREVMRRRRLKAPDVFGPEMGIDPNIVAQYLDNTLPPERYADVERVLLASDEMLAEAAACHQVLTVDPPEVSLATRERLYALGPVDLSSQFVVPAETPEPLTSRTPHTIPIRNGLSPSLEATSNTVKAEDESVTTVPDYLKRSPWSRSAFPSAIIALLVLISAALLGPELWTRMRQAKNEISRKDIRDKNGTPNTPETDTTSMDPSIDVAQLGERLEGVSLPQSPETVKDGKTKLPVGLDPIPPQEDSEDMPALSTTKKANPLAERNANEAATASVERPAKSANVEPSDELPPAPRPAANPAESGKDLPITYASNEGVLLRFDPEHHHWFMVPHRSAMQPGELLANIEPFEGWLDFQKGGIRTTLIGETVVNLLIPGEVGAAGLGIQRGRVILQNVRADENQPLAIGIAIGEDLWKLEFATKDTLCGLEVTPRPPTHFNKVADEHWYQATLYVITGAIRWINREGKSLEVSDHQALNIIPERSAQVRSSPISFPTSPDWCDSVKRKALPTRKHQSHVQFEKAFELDQPIEESMLNLVKGSRFPRIAELAVQCLAATDDYESLVETLAECPHEEARFAARDGLRKWLPLQPDRGQKLKEALDSHYPPADAEAVYQMWWGFSREDVINSKTIPWLFMNWMRSPKVEIRELADYWVEHLTEKKTEYRAIGGTAAQREAHVRRLEEMIERNNGLIKAP